MTGRSTTRHTHTHTLGSALIQTNQSSTNNSMSPPTMESNSGHEVPPTRVYGLVRGSTMRLMLKTLQSNLFDKQHVKQWYYCVYRDPSRRVDLSTLSDTHWDVTTRAAFEERPISQFSGQDNFDRVERIADILDNSPLLKITWVTVRSSNELPRRAQIRDTFEQSEDH